MNVDSIRTLAWAAKTAPACSERCPALTMGGLCTCGALLHRLRAERDFARAMTPDLALRLLDGESDR